MSASSVVGAGSVRLRVRVSNGAYRSFMPTRTAARPSAAMSRVTWAASSRTAPATCPQTDWLCWNVVSRPCPRATYGVASTGEESTPRPSRRYHGPIVGPSRSASTCASVAASSFTVWMPRSASLAAVLRPMPHSASVGRSPITSNQVSVVSRPTPRGLPNEVAIFAWSLLSPMPTELWSRVLSSTAVRTSAAKVSGSSVRTARNASSHPSTCTGTSNDRSVSITTAEAAS